MPLDSSCASHASARVKRFHNSRLHKMVATSRTLRAVTLGLLTRLELTILAGHKDPVLLKTINDVRHGRESLMSGNEAFTLFTIARAQARLSGSMAEVGVFQGCSARLISLASEGKPLHLFDTFEGLPQPEGHEQDQLRCGYYAASLESVSTFLQDRPAIMFHHGIFPETAASCATDMFSFVHLDVDLKSSTRACLEFFYPRMIKGGIILTHDYSYLPGVCEAFSEFLDCRPERAIELPTSQAMLIKH